MPDEKRGSTELTTNRLFGNGDSLRKTVIQKLEFLLRSVSLYAVYKNLFR